MMKGVLLSLVLECDSRSELFWYGVFDSFVDPWDVGKGLGRGELLRGMDSMGRRHVFEDIYFRSLRSGLARQLGVLGNQSHRWE